MKKSKKALKIVIGYVLCSLLWSVFSNKALGQLSSNIEGVLELDQYRGYLYIILSASFLYFIINNMEIRYTNKITTLKAKNNVLKQEIESLRMKLDFNEHTNRKLEGYANIDELTGLYNRRKGLELIREQVDLAASLENTMLISFIDIDNLKVINDTFGHIEGDLLLISVAMIIRYSVARKDIICRYGGDEFLIALPGASMNDIHGIKKRLETAVSDYNAHSCKSYSINISIGFSEYNIERCRNIEELIQEADENMYISKMAKQLPLVSSFR